jgi:hypothetical protein
VQFGDATDPSIAKFEMTVSSITLTGAGGTANTANLLAAPVEFEFSHAAGAVEPVSLAKVPAGTYSAATVTWSNPEVVQIVTNVPTKLTPSPTSGTVNVTFSANLTIGSGQNFLNFDLDLSKTLTISGTTATISPTFNVTATALPTGGNGEDDHDGEMDDVHGKVTAIAAPKFTVQTNAGASIDFTTDANTKFNDGLTQLSDLKVGDIVEVDASTQADGTHLATKVEREGSQSGEEAEGLIQKVDNPLTTITIVHQLDSTSAAAPTTVNITVNASTAYSVRADKLNVTGTFDATHIGAGQRIEADADGQASPIVARKVKLREQAIIGTVSAASGTGFTLTPDPKSAFAQLAPAGTTLAVSIVSGTQQKVTPTNAATVRVRGIVFVSGTTYTMTAAKIDNNQ